MCVSIHLERWLNKLKIETATWAVVGVARQRKSVTILFQNFGSVNAIDVDSIRIQTGSSVKRPLIVKYYVCTHVC